MSCSILSDPNFVLKVSLHISYTCYYEWVISDYERTKRDNFAGLVGTRHYEQLAITNEDFKKIMHTQSPSGLTVVYSVALRVVIVWVCFQNKKLT